MAPPASSPQNAPPIPNQLTPAAATRKVITAGSRSAGSATAPIKAPAKEPSSARPATASISSGGAAAMNAVAAPANRPITM